LGLERPSLRSKCANGGGNIRGKRGRYFLIIATEQRLRNHGVTSIRRFGEISPYKIYFSSTNKLIQSTLPLNNYSIMYGSRIISADMHLQCSCISLVQPSPGTKNYTRPLIGFVSCNGYVRRLWPQHYITFVSEMIDSRIESKYIGAMVTVHEDDCSLSPS